MGGARVVVVAKRTSWQRFVDEGEDPHVRALVEHADPSVAKMRASHEEHLATLREVEASLRALAWEATFVDRAHTTFDSTGVDLVLTVGGDGTLLAASHNVTTVPVLAINSAPGSSVGFFCAGRLGEVDKTLRAFASGALPRVTLTRMEVARNDAVLSRRVLNDALVCHASPAATSRYLIELAGRDEEQRSSGFWVGPAAGSTAAQRSAGGRVLPLASQALQLVVREPYTPYGRALTLTRELIEPGESLRVRSKMHNAKLYIDGPQVSFDLCLGDRLEFRRSDEPLTVLGLSRRRREPPVPPG